MRRWPNVGSRLVQRRCKTVFNAESVGLRVDLEQNNLFQLYKLSMHYLLFTRWRHIHDIVARQKNVKHYKDASKPHSLTHRVIFMGRSQEAKKITGRLFYWPNHILWTMTILVNLSMPITTITGFFFDKIHYWLKFTIEYRHWPVVCLMFSVVDDGPTLNQHSNDSITRSTCRCMRVQASNKHQCKWGQDYFFLVRAWRELHGSTSEMDSIAKTVVLYAGGQCTLRPKISWKMWV